MCDLGVVPAWGHDFTALGSWRLTWRETESCELKLVGLQLLPLLFILFNTGEPEIFFLLFAIHIKNIKNVGVGIPSVPEF